MWRKSPIYDVNVWHVIESFLPTGEKLHQVCAYTSAQFGNPLVDFPYTVKKITSELEKELSFTTLSNIRWLLKNYTSHILQTTEKVFLNERLSFALRRKISYEYNNYKVSLIDFLFISLISCEKIPFTNILIKNFDINLLENYTIICLVAIYNNNIDVVEKLLSQNVNVVEKLLSQNANVVEKALSKRISFIINQDEYIQPKIPIIFNKYFCRAVNAYNIVEFAIVLRVYEPSHARNTNIIKALCTKFNRPPLVEIIEPITIQHINDAKDTFYEVILNNVRDQPINLVYNLENKEVVTNVSSELRRLYDLTLHVYRIPDIYLIHLLTEHNIILPLKVYILINPMAFLREIHETLRGWWDRPLLMVFKWLEWQFPNIVNWILTTKYEGSEKCVNSIYHTIWYALELEDIFALSKKLIPNLIPILKANITEYIESININSDKNVLKYLVGFEFSKEDNYVLLTYMLMNNEKLQYKDQLKYKDSIITVLKVLHEYSLKNCDRMQLQSILDVIKKSNTEEQLEFLKNILDEENYGFLIDKLMLVC